MEMNYSLQTQGVSLYRFNFELNTSFERIQFMQKILTLRSIHQNVSNLILVFCQAYFR